MTKPTNKELEELGESSSKSRRIGVSFSQMADLAQDNSSDLETDYDDTSRLDVD